MPRRDLVWLIVILAHASLITALWLSQPRLSAGVRTAAGYPALLLLPLDVERRPVPRLTLRLDSTYSRGSAVPEPTPPSIATDSTAITLSPSGNQPPRIDWDRELALEVQSGIARSAKERSYRDLSSLTPEQLDWVKQNHMTPMPGFQWDPHSRRELLRHGIVKINDYCVLIVVMPFCRFGGKIQYDGDLFKHMHDPERSDR